MLVLHVAKALVGLRGGGVWDEEDVTALVVAPVDEDDTVGKPPEGGHRVDFSARDRRDAFG